MAKQYVTTAIDYPNAAPHMGHVLEKVLADVCVRWMRLQGDEVRFQIGTDEHGSKIEKKAREEAVTPQALVDRNVALFTDLYDRLHISYDLFVRTTDQKAHWPTVIALWKKLQEAGTLEKRTYTGLYCTGCERFLLPKDLVDGLCPDHQRAPEEVSEENWFFLLSKETAFLQEVLTKKGGLSILPEYRKAETLALLERGLEDVSFSRPRSSVSWGIPVPDDSEQTMYVWCDALTNYISSLGFFTDHEDRSWWDDATVTHIIGKDIARFHALLWPAMLRSAGLRAPDRLLMHGFITNEGQKMSKSLGNVIEPPSVLERFNGSPDPLRFFLCHEIPVGRDGDFSWKRLEELYIAVLSNKIGNLLNRVLVLLRKDGDVLEVPSSPEGARMIEEHWRGYAEDMQGFSLSDALAGHAVALAMAGNVRMEERKPWSLSGGEKREVLGSIAELLRHISLMLLPFLPDTAYRMSKQLNVPYAEQMLKRDFVITDQMKTWGGCPEWKAVGEPSILFASLG